MSKLAIIGPGRMGQIYAEAALKTAGAELIAICGNSRKNESTLMSKFSCPLYFENQWQKMLDEHPDIETVFVATSEWAHLEPALAVLKAKKNLILEKPIATQWSDAVQIDQAVKKSAVIALPCFTSRFDSRLMAARDKLNTLGNLGYLYSRRNVDYGTASRILGKMPLVHWILGHDVDLLRWFTGSEPDFVFAQKKEDPKTGGFFLVQMSFKNGVKAIIEHCAMGPSHSERYFACFDIQGENGRIEVDLTRPDPSGADQLLVEHFIQVSRKSVQPRVQWSDGMRAMEICEAIEASAKNNEGIRLK
jgi:predicted dehydrogenase